MAWQERDGARLSWTDRIPSYMSPETVQSDLHLGIIQSQFGIQSNLTAR